LKTAARVFIIDDQSLVRRGVSGLIQGEPDLIVAGESDGSGPVLEELSTARPDLLIIETALSGRDGNRLLKEIRSRHPELPVLVLSVREEEIFVERALRDGALAYVLKDADGERVIRAIRKVLEGGDLCERTNRHEVVALREQ